MKTMNDTIEQRADSIIQYLQQYYLEEQGFDEDWYFALTRLSDNINEKIDQMFKIRDLKRNPDKIKAWILKNIEHYSLYHSIFAFTKPHRKSQFALQQSRVVFIDLDKEGHQEITMKEVNEVLAPLLLDKLKSRGIHYSIIHSGRGIHIKIILDEPLTNEEYKKLSILNQLLRDTQYNADNIYDLDRIIRLPFSRNIASKKEAKILFKDNTITPKTALMELVNELEKKRRAEINTEKQFDVEAVVDLDNNKISDLARDIYNIIKYYYRTGTRHNLMFFTL